MKPEKIYYFDNNATTRVAPEVVEAMLPFLTECWGNPSSAYEFGHRVAKPLEQARIQVAGLINADPREIVFTSCGTESDNAALQSAFRLLPEKRHLVTTAVEHSAVLNYCKFLQNNGCEITYLPVEPDGTLDLHQLERAIRPDTALVSVMWANNETGVVFPIEEISAICRSRDVLFHTDAVQAAGKIVLDVRETGVDLLSLSGHKLYAPKGVGVLYARRGVQFHPYLIGGHQERGRRAGTENVAGCIAFGRAAELAAERFEDQNTRIRELRDRLENGVLSGIPGTTRNGARDARLPNTTNLGFDGVEAEAVLMMLDRIGVCVSSGSACATGSLEPSHVLTAMGVRPSQARGAVRFSLGGYNTREEVDFLLEKLPPIIERLRGSLPSRVEPVLVPGAEIVHGV